MPRAPPVNLLEGRQSAFNQTESIRLYAILERNKAAPVLPGATLSLSSYD